MAHEPTLTDVNEKLDTLIEIVQDFATNVDQRFEQVDRRFEQVDKRFEQVDRRFEQIDERFERIEGRVNRIDSGMVTKDYLDRRLGQTEGNLIALARRQDEKTNVLVEELHIHGVLDGASVKRVMSKDPFKR